MTRELSGCASAFCLIVMSAPLAAQPAPATKASTAVIRGRITAMDGAALRRARVSLLPVAQAVGTLQIAASTNSQGHYELKEVPAGLYRVSATRGGYLATQFGQRRAGQTGQTVEVRAGQMVDHIDISLPRGGVLAGRIVDELGEPYPGVRVEAQDLRYVNGRRVPFPAGGATTDDLGEFRISGLTPGPYYLMGSSRETWLGEKKEPYGYAPTYFPGKPPEEAQIVTVEAARERTNLDFALSVSRTGRISGTLYSSGGAPAEAQAISLSREIRGTTFIVGGLTTTLNTGRGGSFEFANVPPGEYLLRASAENEVAVSHPTVAGADIEGLVLTRRTGSAISGTIVADDGNPPDFQATRLRIDPITIDIDKTLPTPIYLAARIPKPDWTFTIPNVAGPYLIRVEGLPSDWMLKTVRLQDRDITDSPIDVPTGDKDISDVELVLTKKTATVSGTVVDRDGKGVPDATVIVFAETADRWGPGSRFVKMARPDANSQFAISGLPGGTYRIIASETIVDGQWEDVEFLSSVQDNATRIQLTEGAAQRITLRVVR